MKMQSNVQDSKDNAYGKKAFVKFNSPDKARDLANKSRNDVIGINGS